MGSSRSREVLCSLAGLLYYMGDSQQQAHHHIVINLNFKLYHFPWFRLPSSLMIIGFNNLDITYNFMGIILASGCKIDIPFQKEIARHHLRKNTKVQVHECTLCDCHFMFRLMFKGFSLTTTPPTPLIISYRTGHRRYVTKGRAPTIEEQRMPWHV